MISIISQCHAFDIYTDPKGVNITLLLEEYEDYHVAVTLEWTEQTFIRSYYVYVLPLPTLRFTESAGVQFNATYNTLYYVNIITACGQSNVTTSIELHYSEFLTLANLALLVLARAVLLF